MRTTLGLLLLSLAGCPNKAATTSDPPADKAVEKADDTYHPYKDARPEKVKADVEAAQKKEEDRDDKIFDKAKQ
jgi:hypothetical protein